MYIQQLCGLEAFFCVDIYAEMPRRMRLSYKKDRARNKRATSAKEGVHDML